MVRCKALPISINVAPLALILWCLCYGAGWPCLAQNSVTGAVRGQVLDRTGQPFPGVPVTITNRDTNERRTRRTTADGSYHLDYLPPGRYKIVAHGKPSYSYDVGILVEISLNHWRDVRLPAFTFGRAQLTIELTWPNGAPFSKAKVRALNAATGKPFDADQEVEVPKPGEYCFSFIGDGKYRIELMREGLWKPVLSVNVRFDDNPKPSHPATFSGSLPGPQPDAAIFFQAEVTDADAGIAVSLAEMEGDSGDANALSDTPTETRPVPEVAPPAQQPAVVSVQPPPSDTMENSARLQLVNTFSAARGQDFTARQLQALPTGGRAEMRSYDELAFLVAGVVPAPYTFGPRGPGVGFGVNAAGGFAVNGQRARANNFTVDGSDHNDPDVGGRRQGFVALVPQSIESTQGFSISTLLWNAELGRNLGAQVNVVSRYGTNEFHGQAYGFLTSSRLNARNFFDYSDNVFSEGQDSWTRTMTGVTLSGPIKRHRTHFFGSLEQVSLAASTEQHFATPTTMERRFKERDQSDRFGVLLPSFTRFRTIQDGTPLGRSILSLYPAPNNPGGPFGENTWSKVLPNDGDGTLLSFKVTHQLAPNHLFNARYNFTDDQRLLPTIDQAINSTTEALARTQNLSIIYDNTARQRASVQLRFSYGRTQLRFAEFPGSPFEIVPEPIQSSQTGRLGGVHIEPFSPVGVDVFNLDQSRVSHTLQAAGAFSLQTARHSFRFGVEALAYRFDSRQERNYRPLVSYSGALLARGVFESFRFTQQGPTEYLPGVKLAALGVPSSIFQTLTFGTQDSLLRLRSAQYSFFANDNWRLKPHFTLDYGLRYEYSTVPHDADKRLERALQLSELPSSDGSLINTMARTDRFDVARNAYQQLLRNRPPIYQPDRNNLAPHLGFAWAPWGNGKTALRGGFGLYYGVPLGAAISLSRNVFPNEIPVNIDPSFLSFDLFSLNRPAALQIATGSAGTLPNPIPLILPNTLNQLGGEPKDFVALMGQLFLQNRKGGGLAFTLPSSKMPTPYSRQWHLTVEREVFGQALLSVAYVGTKGAKLTRLITPNLGPHVTAFVPIAPTVSQTDDTPTPTFITQEQLRLSRGPRLPGSATEKRPSPALGPYQLIENSAASTYHALQIEARRRFQRGYLFTFAYTYSHAIDDVSDIFPLGGASNLPQNSRKLWLERASANFDLRHRVAASWVWELPFYRDRQTARARWLGGWQLAALWQVQTGPPFTLNVPFDANQDGNLTDRPKTVDGLEALRQHDRQRVRLKFGVSPEQFFDICPAGCDDGVVGRNTMRGDGFASLDVALEKQFRRSDRRRLVWRTEVFNVFNRANFGLPVRTIGSPGFGAAVETVSPARMIQFALRFSF